MKNDFCIKGDITEIYITNGTVLIDTEDLRRVSKYSWFPSGKGYAQARIGTKKICMHRLLLNLQPSNKDREQSVDHINRNRLDNRKENLRICSHIENMQNQSLRSNNTSGIRGVYFDSKRNRYVAQITYFKKRKTIGYFDTLEKAKLARKLEEDKLKEE